MTAECSPSTRITFLSSRSVATPSLLRGQAVDVISTFLSVQQTQLMTTRPGVCSVTTTVWLIWVLLRCQTREESHGSASEKKNIYLIVAVREELKQKYGLDEISPHLGQRLGVSPNNVNVSTWVACEYRGTIQDRLKRDSSRPARMLSML